MIETLTSLCLLSVSSAYGYADGVGIPLGSVTGVPWWLWTTLGILWVCACLVGVFSVSAVLLVWAYRQIRGQEGSGPHPPQDRGHSQETHHPNVVNCPSSPGANGADLLCEDSRKAPAERTGEGQVEPAEQPPRRENGVVGPGDGRPVNCLVRRQRSDGAYYWCEIHGNPLHDAAGEVMGIAAIADNYTTNGIESRRSLKEPQENYRMVFEELAEGFALYEIIRDRKGKPADYRILDANPAFQRCVGSSAEDLIGRLVSELDADSIPMGAEQLTTTAEGGDPGQFSWCCKRTEKDFSVICYRAGDGRIATLLLDVTDRHRAEQERRMLQEQLHQSRKMEAIGQLAGGIAHDFNNLLTAIQGNAELIQIDPAASTGQLECAEQILQASHRVSDLTQQLLAFGRQGNFQTVIVDMHEAIRETAKLLSHSIDRKIEIHQELYATSPAVMGDPSQLKNMLLNLGINARDAMPNGGRITFSTRTVHVDEEYCRKNPSEITPGECMEIAVTDTGTGMDQATRKRVFEPFFTTKKVGEGTGLGLAGAYGCVKNHHGFIEVDSEVGKGSTFRIFLPPAESQQGIYTSCSEQEQDPAAKHILLIDDEVMVRNYGSRVLRTLGYRVSLCSDGKEAVAFYREHYRDIDLVILDLVMPRMDGEEAFREMKAINPDIRTLLTSGYGRSEKIEALRREGVLGFLNKPFQIEDLSKYLTRYLEDAPVSQSLPTNHVPVQ